MSGIFQRLGRRELLAALGVCGIAVPFALRESSKSGSQETPELTDPERSLVAAMAEGIIPATDTPGAIGAGVPDFLAMMFKDWLLPEEQAVFRTGLESYQADARRKFGKDYLSCSAAQQMALLTEWDKAASAVVPGAAKPPFAVFKALTIVGYYTSQVGQEQELGITMNPGLDDPRGPAISINVLQI